MRRAVQRIGQALASTGALADPDDVFFLTRDEVQAALDQPTEFTAPDIAGRRATREEQARLVPPLLIGKVNPMLKRMWEQLSAHAGSGAVGDSAGHGQPGLRRSRNRAGPRRPRSGRVRHAPAGRGPGGAADGAGLDAALHARRGVVTDVGSPASHASIIAREYGIPAIVGCGDATARLTTGMRVTVDGWTGNVEPAQ